MRRSLIGSCFAALLVSVLPASAPAGEVLHELSAIEIVSAPRFPAPAEVPPPEDQARKILAVPDPLAGGMPAQGLVLDTQDREAVRNFYNGLYAQAEVPAMNWTGDYASGNAGTTDARYQSGVLLRVNWFRAMAGVPANVALYAPYSAKAQQAALMMSANGQLSHFPPASWLYYTADGAEAAKNSNLSYGNAGPLAVLGQVRDAGANNTFVGHRRWVLYPQTRLMGTGDVPGGVSGGVAYSAANVLWVFDSNIFAARPAVRDDFVAWPPKGYVPFQTVFGRWSFSYPNADFAAASVTVRKNGVDQPVSLESVATGYGENTIVWLLQGTTDQTVWPRPGGDEVYSVTVSNVFVAGAARSFSYDVIVFDPATPTANAPQTLIVPPASADVGVPFTVSAATAANATAFAVAGYRVTGAAETMTPANAGSDWSASTGVYNPVESSAFHLYHASGADQVLTLGKPLILGSDAALSFDRWFGFTATTEKASVQISLNDGLGWQTVYSEDGTDAPAGLATRSVSLAAFGGRLARFRFVLSTTSAYYPCSSCGWYFTNIRVADASLVANAFSALIPAGQGSAGVTVDVAGKYLLVGQTQYQGMYYSDLGQASSFRVGSGAVSIPAPQAGWWWNPAEGGRGFAIEQQGNNLFLAAYLYAAGGRAAWYAAGPAPMNGSVFTSPLLSFGGGQTLTGAYRSPGAAAGVGNVSINFIDAKHGTLIWPGGSFPIQRFDIVTGGAALTPPAATPEAGWWWSESESGRGYSLEIQDGVMFIGAYMYDDAGNPIWYASGPAPMAGLWTYQGTWQQFGNGQTLTGAYQRPEIVNPNLGGVTLQFTSPTAGVLTLPNGRPLAIVRFRY